MGKEGTAEEGKVRNGFEQVLLVAWGLVGVGACGGAHWVHHFLSSHLGFTDLVSGRIGDVSRGDFGLT